MSPSRNRCGYVQNHFTWRGWEAGYSDASWLSPFPPEEPSPGHFCSPLPKCVICRLSTTSWNAFLFISSSSEDQAVAMYTRGCALYKFLGGCKSVPCWSRKKTGGSLLLSSCSVSASSSQPLTVLPLLWTSLYSSVKWCFLINPSGVSQVWHANLRQELVFSWYTFKLLPLDISLQEPGTHVACVSHFRVWLEVWPLETRRRLMVWLKLISCVTWASSLASLSLVKLLWIYQCLLGPLWIFCDNACLYTLSCSHLSMAHYYHLQ